MTIPVAPSNLRRRQSQMHNVNQSNSAKARLFLAVACVWPLLVFFFASSGKNTLKSPNDHKDVVAEELESIRNLLDRVDILGYGPTHPRVAVVVVGDDAPKILSSVESVFRYEAFVERRRDLTGMVYISIALGVSHIQCRFFFTETRISIVCL
jgi:hypothetical protein